MIKLKMSNKGNKVDYKNRVTPQERYYNKVQHMDTDELELEKESSIKFRGYTIIKGKKYKVFN